MINPEWLGGTPQNTDKMTGQTHPENEVTRDKQTGLCKVTEVFNCKNGVKIQRMEADEENWDEKFGLKKIYLRKKTNKNIKTKWDVWTAQLTGPQWLLQDGSEE